MLRNRHPADELFDVRTHIAELKERETELRNLLMEPGANLEGSEFVVRLRDVTSEHIRKEDVIRLFGRPAVAGILSKRTSTYVTLVAKRAA